MVSQCDFGSSTSLHLSYGATDATQWSLEPLRAALTDLGYPTWCEDVPTQRGDPSKGVDDDVLFLRQAIESIIAAGQDVIVCGWSMSAWSAPAAVEGLTGRRTAGRGAVIGLVYMACVIPEKCPMDAQSIMDQYGGANGAWYSPEELAAAGMEYVSGSSTIREVNHTDRVPSSASRIRRRSSSKGCLLPYLPRRSPSRLFLLLRLRSACTTTCRAIRRATFSSQPCTYPPRMTTLSRPESKIRSSPRKASDSQRWCISTAVTWSACATLTS